MQATRYFCGNCGTGVYTDSGGFFGCSPALFGAEDGFRLPAPLLPQVHLYYGSSCLLGVVKDGGQLALYNDVPKTFGGSGETIQGTAHSPALSVAVANLSPLTSALMLCVDAGQSKHGGGRLSALSVRPLC